MGGSPDEFVGVLEVLIHQARDIHNICIYHKQDVYAKLCLTSDPEVTISTKTINGGGKNPVFNENHRFNVRTIESSLKCEVWMLSRVRNYLEDQLLGFALVPLSDVVIGNGKLAQEFSLSSTDLFHSPAGFVELSLTYFGSSPDVMAIPTPWKSKIPEADNGPDPCELDKIEFPDLNVVKENEMMVSEYFGIPCTDLKSLNTKSLDASENGNCSDDDAGIRVVESFASSENSLDSALKKDTPQSSVSTNGSPPSPSETSQSISGPSEVSASLTKKDKIIEASEGETDSSVAMSDNSYVSPGIHINFEQEETVIQQDIVDMYMKSMQQFTDSLAKMKLPLDMETSSSSTENASPSSEQKVQSVKGTGPRVFYGSRAFF